MTPQMRNRERTQRREKRPEAVFDKEAWMPKTELGKKVKSGQISSIDEIFKSGKKIMEAEIIDCLFPDLQVKTVDIKKTTRVTRAGRHFSFRVSVIVGDGNGHIGVGTGKNIERITAQQKAVKNAKLNIVPIKRGCGSWECNCTKKHSIPFKTMGKSASLRVELLPAPNGVGLAVSDTIKPVLQIAGIVDIWSSTRGSTDTKLNFVRATVKALENLSSFKFADEKEAIKETEIKE
ncbi:MAG: 30S ribosomal protein S5 [Candidatus ainarchaeum sp.]|jgi:small subunit ribosomal protein S5|nr:30S ribosomal protein S5 [Candidatus ainarchaeum sp.]